MMTIKSIILQLRLLFVSLAITGSATSASVSDGTLDIGALVATLRGEDYRLFRWDATEETLDKQPEACERSIFDKVIDVITSGVAIDASEETLTRTFQALEYVTFCVTDNPTNRAVFANYKGVHESIIDLVSKFIPSLETSVDEITKGNVAAGAAHVIYITTYGNAVNHQTYISLNAVQNLSKLILVTAAVSHPPSDVEGHIEARYPWVTMWASAALSNLAANYCETENDGRCYYTWTDTGMTVELDSLPVVSDGSVVRTQILADTALTKELAMLSCIGPIPEHYDAGEDEEDRPISASTAQIDRDEHNNELISWAAVSVVKNLAIDPKSHPIIEESIGCFCHHSVSSDWLEEDKGQGTLRHLRRDYPCWFSARYNSQQEFVGNGLCVDHVYHHENDSTCTDFDIDDEPTEEECSAVDRYGKSAADACCACGGGTILTHPDVDNAADEL